MKHVALCAALVLAAGPAAAAEDCRADRVDLRGSWGQAEFTVKVADDARERGVGLMNVPSMARSEGMLFVYDHPQGVAFWMKNTLIPLDMIFLDETGTVQRVHANAIPHDETPIPGGDNIQFVLEVNGGVAELYGIGPGSELRHPAIPDETAAWPCG